jgi:hypothetical protein
LLFEQSSKSNTWVDENNMRVAVDDIKEKVRRIVMFLTVESLRKEK